MMDVAFLVGVGEGRPTTAFGVLLQVVGAAAGQRQSEDRLVDETMPGTLMRDDQVSTGERSYIRDRMYIRVTFEFEREGT